ncbi:MAG: zf-HC2 domain-containing protein [Actinomycetota bacterium]|nr:zf-HC2 domain-containing protein [Actinomycetota bacterium]
MTIPHLDQEALSAALDGQATAADRAHLDTCPQCREDMAALATVARAVAGPVPPRPQREVDAAIERAVASWSPVAPVESLASDDGGAEPVNWGRPTPSRPAGAPPHRPARQGRGSHRWLETAAGLAAAVIVVGGVVALSRRTSNHPSSTTSSPALGAGPSRSSPRFGTSYGTDLGDQSDPGTVARLVVGALPAGSAGAARVPGPEDTSTVPARSATTPADQLPTDQLPAATCEAEARAAVGLTAGGSAVVRYFAMLRWRGQPSVVVVLAKPGGLAGVIMRTADCSVLAVLPL